MTVNLNPFVRWASHWFRKQFWIEILKSPCTIFSESVNIFVYRYYLLNQINNEKVNIFISLKPSSFHLKILFLLPIYILSHILHHFEHNKSFSKDFLDEHYISWCCQYFCMKMSLCQHMTSYKKGYIGRLLNICISQYLIFSLANYVVGYWLRSFDFILLNYVNLTFWIFGRRRFHSSSPTRQLETSN